MPNFLSRGFQIVLDFTMLSLAFWLAFVFRFEAAIPHYWMRVALLCWPYAIGLQYIVLVATGVTKLSWRYFGLGEAGRIGLAVVAAGVLMVVVRVIAASDSSFQLGAIPFGVLGMNFCLAFVGLVGIRAIRRVYGESQKRKRWDSSKELVRVLLIGAGDAGVLVAREITARPDLGLGPVGFLDDDRLKHGTRIAGLPVLGSTADLREIAEQQQVKRALITIANASGVEIRRILVACQEAGLETKIIPGIYEIVDDRVNLSRIRAVAIEDLLGREPVKLDETSITTSIRGAVVMVTGAGGSIGSELCRQICRYAPARLVLAERFENALFEIHRELIGTFPDLKITPRIADVCDVPRMAHIFEQDKPSIVFHAAAHKHVPMMESNPGEAIKNNVGGTRALADLADRFDVSRFVLVSTDKAVNPTSVMGATKRIAEIYTQALARRSKTSFVTVRFGNVLGSNGSVIPIFKEQIARGGPVTVTHPDMERYFMTIPEASQLVLQAGAMGRGGEIFILDMGKPVKIVDLVRDLIALSGLQPGEIEIAFSGIRPGEKLFEELATDSERADTTSHPKIFVGRVRPTAWDDVIQGIERLLDLAKHHSSEEILRASLRALVPEYKDGSVKPVVFTPVAPVVAPVIGRESQSQRALSTDGLVTTDA